MKILAISGSGRHVSTNTAMLRAFAQLAGPEHQVTVFNKVADLPVFSPDLESGALPAGVQVLADLIDQSDGVIIASPEYARAIPGGLKNAIDWLVSREELTDKPMALLHASYRGEDMLAQLRLVLATVSARFAVEIFARFDLMKRSPDEIAEILGQKENRQAIDAYLRKFDLFSRPSGV